MDYYTQEAGGDSFHDWEQMVYPSKHSFHRPSSLNTSESAPGFSQASTISTPGPPTPNRPGPSLMSPYSRMEPSSHVGCEPTWYLDPNETLSPTRSARFDRLHWPSGKQRIHDLTADAMHVANHSQCGNMRQYLDAPGFPATQLSLNPTLPLHWVDMHQTQYSQQACMQPDAWAAPYATPAAEDIGHGPVLSPGYDGSHTHYQPSASTHGQVEDAPSVAPSAIHSSFSSQSSSEENFADRPDAVPNERDRTEIFFSQRTPTRRPRRRSSAKVFTSVPRGSRTSARSRRNAMERTECTSYHSTDSPIEVSFSTSQASKDDYPCPVVDCGIGFKRQEHLRRHLKTTHHKGDNLYLCALAFGGGRCTCTINNKTTSRKQPEDGVTRKKPGIGRRDNQYQHYATHLKKKDANTRNKLVSKEFLFYVIVKYEEVLEDARRVLGQLRKACAKPDFRWGVPDQEFMKSHRDWPEFQHWLARQEQMPFLSSEEYLDEPDFTAFADDFAHLILSDVKCEVEDSFSE